jgi:hypothetical protein
MRKITAILFFLPFVFFIGCQKDLSNQEAVQPDLQADESQYFEPSETFLRLLEDMKNEPTLTTRSGCDWISIPAGSKDALQKAIDGARSGSIIYLSRGEHTETKMIKLTKTINIIGAKGAVLKVKSAVSAFDATTAKFALNPAIHIYNAPHSSVQNLEIRPIEGDGSSAIVIENSNETTIYRCKIPQFQTAILVENSDKVAIMYNTVVCSSSWQTAEAGFGESIVIVNGKSAYIGNNEVSNSLFGIWPCDEFATVQRNYTHGSFLGIILCNVPAALYVLPSGKAVGSKIPTRYSKVRNNNSTDNQFGYLVIDGANNNLLENNNAARNALYDMELTTDTYRFGFLTPKSYNNTVKVGSFKNIRIKDCGENNHINGGIKIDTATDPCN